MSIIRPSLLEDLKQTIAEITFSRTDKVTKITDGSVLNGFFYGMAKTAQKTLKDVALAQSRLFPDDAYGDDLDEVASTLGIAPRLGALGSSTSIRVWGDVGTVYTAGTQTVLGNDGIVFNLLENKIIGAHGFTYIRVSSQITGKITEVNPYTLTRMTSAPVGHKYVTNEYRASGGRDIEDDLSFRQRIKDAFNAMATGTLAKLEQIFMLKNPKVLRLFNHGTNGNGKIELSILSQNGQEFTQNELDDLLANYAKFLSMSEINLDYTTSVGIQLRNVFFAPVDVSFKTQLLAGYVPEDVAKDIQIRINKYIDYRTWVLGSKVEWVDLLQLVRNTPGVQYVPDNSFYPHNDLMFNYAVMPRLRGFEMRNLEDQIIVDTQGLLSPVYYPATSNFNLISNVLRTI